MFFQNTILKKYLAMLDDEQVKAAWEQYKALFLNTQRQDNILTSKEEQYQEGFLRELFVKTLGYTINPDPDFNLITEKKNETDSKKADGAIQRDGKVIGIIELKDHKTPDLKQVETQAFGYKNRHRGTRYVVISNFEKLRFYIDDATEYREWDLFSLKEEDFRELFFCLSWDTLSQDLPIQAKTESVSSEDQITRQLYRDYSAFKRELFADILKNNTTEETPKEQILLLFKKTQKLLDRLLFIFFAEDSGLLPPNSMALILDDWQKLKDMDEYRPLYSRIRKYFGYLDTGFQGKHYEIFAYNGGLFKPDEVLDSITISDEVLAAHCRRLSEYDYASEVDVNILGHIFENSLNEIEEVTAQITNSDNDIVHFARIFAGSNNSAASSVSKRKRDGVFYTPQYITRYIVENTVGRLCAEKKAEMGIGSEGLPSLTQTAGEGWESLTTKDKRAALDQLKRYREWLLGITICDPACGSGAFLNAALRFLMDEHKLLDEMEAKVAGASIVFQNVENAILENNLFGVDINEESVEIAKLALWLRTAKPHRKLSSLNDNIKCGNSLISDPAVAGDKAFNWQTEFPDVFAKGGFDVVIGNPPYFNVETLGYKSKQMEFLQNEYSEIWQDKSDILFYFIYKALQISKGDVGFIVSNAFLFSDKARKLRNHIIDDGRLSQIVNFERYLVFADASITSCITFFNKLHNGVKAFVLKDKDYKTEEIINYISNEQNSFPVNVERNDVFALVDNKISLLNKKIDGNWKQLRDILKVGSGMQTAANDVFCFSEYPLQFPKEYIKRRMCGEIISRYNLRSKEEYMLYFEDVENFEDLPISIQEHLLANKETLSNRATCKNEGRIWWRYSRPMHKEYYGYHKIWCSYRAKSNEFVLDESTDYIGLTNTTVIFGTAPNISLKYILALLNSALLNFRYKSIGKQTGSGVYEYFEVGVGRLPIPVIPLPNQQPFIDLADRMLSLNKDLQEKRARFLQLLQNNLGRGSLARGKDNTAGGTPAPQVKITAALETFDTLDFAGFVAELKKQKIKLSLHQQDEWMDFFTKYKSACNDLSSRIAATDKEIDALVYALYGLTDDEIKLIEQ